MKGKLVFLLLLLGFGSYLLLNISREQKIENRWQGYAETENILVAPQDTTTISAVHVSRGDTVTAGQPLFEMDAAEAKIAVQQAEAALAQANANLENLLTGERPEEILVKKAAIDDAAAALRLAEENHTRQEELFQSGYATKRATQATKAALEQAKAKLDAAKKQLGVAALPARQQQIEAATQAREEAKAKLDNALWRLGRTAIKAPVAGLVEDVIRRAGETASPQQAVVSLLPPDKKFIRFFIPQADLPKFKVGQKVQIACDGCKGGLAATISYIAPKAEYTPPVIYSVQSREKLVFMLEAKPDEASGAGNLQAGQPVDVTLALPTATKTGKHP